MAHKLQVEVSFTWHLWDQLQPGQVFRFAVSSSQPNRQQISRLWRALKSHSTVVVTGLGQALMNVIDVVEALKNKGFIVVDSIRTASVVHPEKRPKTPQLEITVSLKSMYVLPENRQKQVKSLFKTIAASKSGRVSVNDLMNLDLPKAAGTTSEEIVSYATNHLMVLDTYNEGHVDIKDWQTYTAAFCSESMSDEHFDNFVKHIESKSQVQAS